MTQDVYHRNINEHGGAKYRRVIQGLVGTPNCDRPVTVDIYKVLVAFGVTCPALQHAAKKILCAGLRGKGTITEDIKGAMDALFRALEEAELTERLVDDTVPPIGIMEVYHQR